VGIEGRREGVEEAGVEVLVIDLLRAFREELVAMIELLLGLGQLSAGALVVRDLEVGQLDE